MSVAAPVAAHHRKCPEPWDTCRCTALWAVDTDGDDPDDLAHAYGRFYDPDFDADPRAAPESYGGWVRAHREAA